jgi:hypothetical protein
MPLDGGSAFGSRTTGSGCLASTRITDSGHVVCIGRTFRDRRGRLRRIQVMRSAGRLVLALLAATLLTGCGGDAETSGPASPTGQGKRVGSAGVTVALPPGWHKATPHDGAIIDPVTRLVVASAPVGTKSSGCQIASYDFAPTAVAVVVVEWGTPHSGLPEHPNQFSRRTIDVQPPPAIECFDGPGGSVQFVEHGRSFGAYLLAGRQATEAAIDQAQQVVNEIEVAPRPGEDQLARNGVSIGVPDAWNGRLLYRDESGSTGVIYQVANFELPANRGFEPPTVQPGEEDAIKAMAAGDVLVTVVDAASGGEARPPLALADLTAVRGPRVPVGHRLLTGAFCFGGRCLDVSVDFGGEPDPALERAVGDVLASITVAGRDAPSAAVDDGPRGCPRPSWPGPWARCAEARWVALVVEAAGYRVTGNTGSALTAEGGPAEFYIWTTPSRRPLADGVADGAWRQVGTARGRAIYGDDHLWRLWQAQDFVFWLTPGPSAAAKLPSLTELEPLVAASLRLMPPPA